MITIDTLRADHLGCYGFHLARTPAIDKLAAGGVRCADAVAAAPITMPAHSSIFTGLFPVAHGVRDNGAYALGDGTVTLAERLRDAGYTTHAFISALVLNRRYHLDQGFETYDDDLWAEEDPRLFMIRERRAPKTAARFLQWLDGWNRERSKPFFTWVHFFDPHQPYRPDPADAVLSPSSYDAEIAGVDHQIEKIIDTLRRDGILDDTIVVLTADHGESLGEHGEKTHAIFLYDATVRVPLIIRYPKQFEPRVYEGPVRSVDITPTLLDILGIEPREALDGRSLLAALRGKEPPPPLPQYSESLLAEVGFGMAPLYSLRSGGFKYVRAPRPELYDLTRDPHELTNIIAQQPRVALRLSNELTSLMQRSSAHAVKTAANPLSRETEESLQALGYLAPHGERTSMQGIDPKDGLPIHNMLEDARHFAQQGRWVEAQKLAEKVLTLTPRNVSAINVLGLLGIKTGDREEAIRRYRQSLEIDPAQFRVHAILGSLAMSDGNLADAENEYHAALTLNPNFAEVMANLGFLESFRGHRREAEEWYRKGIAADPSFPRVYRRLADLYYERNDYLHAYENYAKASRMLPTDVRSIVQQGNCARRLGRMQEAEALFRRAESLRPDGWIPAYNRACLLAVTGKPQEALDVLNALAWRRDLPERLVDRDADLASVRALPGFPELQRKLEPEQDAEEPPA